MGADLYLTTVPSDTTTGSFKGHRHAPIRMHSPASGKQTLPLNGYFRDSYNATSVLWTLSLSWWRDVLPLLDSASELTGRNLRHFRRQVATATQHLPNADELRAMELSVEQTGFRTVDGLHRYYVRKRKQLLKFLDFAIAHHSAITCSL